ncbi:Vacuolar protein-sorting-associated protein 25 [Amphibalanus amphitrite]|uniref:Vacuolar protein-sorting-associated protein 25 n=1 Tax=Amphibalanus amphitrite TaxID=1232801 RepID=A0A6A4VFR2_AMPAM|nr:Vacuolar protein-sorting-associated protein 25 [Amphibalanus amphitrite]
MVALAMALSWLLGHPEEDPGGPVMLCTDSQSALSALRAGPAAQQSRLGATIWQALLMLAERGRRAQLQWVPSHCGLEGNERADILAKEAAQLPQESAPLDVQTLSSEDAYMQAKKRLTDRYGNAFITANEFKKRLYKWPEVKVGDSRLSEETIQTVLDDLATLGHAEWTDKAKRRCLVLWRSPAEWGQLIYGWAVDSGLVGSVCTLYELTHGDHLTDQPFHGLCEELLVRALGSLQAAGKAELMDNEGVKFF